ncbi:hypothetical protein LguiA_015082 [Lonicera macranthoides]
MEFVNTPFNDPSVIKEENKRRGRMGRSQIDNETEGFKSKNLYAERRRRQKLKDRLLELRALMNKATIITDSIDYIKELQKCVGDLSEKLHEMEVTIENEMETQNYEVNAAKEMKEWGIEAEVNVTQIDANKLWIKIVFKKKRGGISKLMEAMSVLGFEFVDMSVTTTKGAVLVTSCVEGIHGGMLEVDKIHELLVEIIRGI